MTLRAVTAIAIRFDGRVIRFEPNMVFTVSPQQAERLLDLAPDRLEILNLPPGVCSRNVYAMNGGRL